MASAPRTLRLIGFGRSSLVALARGRGLLAERGLDVETTLTPSSTEQMRGVGEGKWDIASTAFDNVLPPPRATPTSAGR